MSFACSGNLADLSLVDYLRESDLYNIEYSLLFNVFGYCTTKNT